MKLTQLGIPIAIVLAGALIALALFFSGRSAGGASASPDGFGNTNSAAASSIRPVTDDDHIFGNPDAPVTIVEFSDFECPFCARLHPTLARTVSESDGQVRWVYRHFPLSSIHRNAESAAIASECVANLGGNDAFWKFGTALFNNQHALGAELYTDEAAKYGISAEQLALCTKDSAVGTKVTNDFNEAINAGGRGTPFAVIISTRGQFFPFSGALPYEQIQSIIKQAKTK